MNKLNKVKTTGILQLEKHGAYENVECKFSHNSKSGKGYFFFENPSQELQTAFMRKHVELNELILKFEFSYHKTKINGLTNGISSINDVSLRIDFNITEFYSVLKDITQNIPKELNIVFTMPYISFFDRTIRNKSFLGNDKLLELIDEKFKFDLLGYNFEFIHNISTYQKDLNKINVHADLGLKISKYGDSYIDIKNSIRNLENIVSEIFVLLSFIFSTKIDSNGWYLIVIEEDNKYGYEIFYRNYERKLGKPLKQKKYKVCRNFNKYFIPENITKLTYSFVNKEEITRTRIKGLIYFLSTCIEMEYVNTRFINAYFLLTAISKYIVKNERSMTDSNLFGKALEITGLEYYRDVFRKKIWTKKDTIFWHIEEIRIHIAHSNSGTKQYQYIL